MAERVFHFAQLADIETLADHDQAAAGGLQLIVDLVGQLFEGTWLSAR